MRFTELVQRSRLLLGAAIALQWATTVAVAVRAEHVSVGFVELLNVVALGPLALLCAHRLATRLSGVALGAWALLVWVATPWLVMGMTLSSYDATVRNDVLPLSLGLTPDGGYAAGVALLACLTLLADEGRIRTAGAGLAAGAAIVLVPEAIVFLVPMTVVLLGAWRPRELRAFLVAASPAVLVVALWRQPSFGELSLDALQANLTGLREYFFSQRLLQWLPLAGTIAVARRSIVLALLLGGWLAAWVAIGAARVGAGFESGELFRVLLPALPAYVLLAAALPLLVPTLAARLGPLARPVES